MRNRPSMSPRATSVSTAHSVTRGCAATRCPSANRSDAMRLCLLFLALVSASAVARPPTVADFLGLEELGATVVSPDGAFAVVEIRRPRALPARRMDAPAREVRSDLWLVNLKEGSIRRLTNG